MNETEASKEWQWQRGCLEGMLDSLEARCSENPGYIKRILKQLITKEKEHEWNLLLKQSEANELNQRFIGAPKVTKMVEHKQSSPEPPSTQELSLVVYGVGTDYMETKEVNSGEALMFDEMFLTNGMEVSSQIPVLDQVDASTVLQKSFIRNESIPQFIFHNRQESYEQLEMDGIHVPRYVLAITDYYFIKEKDFIVVHGNRFWKPFVEKHIDGDYNSIRLYYVCFNELIAEWIDFQHINSILCSLGHVIVVQMSWKMVVVYLDRFRKVFELKNVHMSVRRFLFDIGATLDAINSVYFQPMGDAIFSGRNMPFMPPCNDLQGSILKKSMEMMKSDDEKLITSCVRISCYNLTNRWNIQPCRILLHFLGYCAKGVLLKSIYASTVINSSDALYEILKQVVEEVRFKLGLQVITNCDEQYTRRRLAETFPALHWTLRAAHCIGLILEDFVKVEWINTIIEQARFMTRFIYKHSVLLNMVRIYTFDNDTGELAATRSATNFTTLTHMVDLRNNLQPMVTSHEWIDCPYLQKSRGRKFFFSSSVEKHVFWTDHKRNFSLLIMPYLDLKHENMS
ncbi:hypothetical protein GQ457_08G013330 [Hibiscus cannabinus]